MSKQPQAKAAEAEKPAKGSGTGDSRSLDVFADRLRAYGDFVRAVGEYKLRQAQAELLAAQSANEWEKVQILDAIRRQLVIDLERLNRQTIIWDRQIRDVRKRARLALFLLGGRPMAAFNTCADAYKAFERLALLQANSLALYQKLDLAQDPITGDDFEDNRGIVPNCPNPTGAALQNALSLMDWAIQHQFYARPGSNAQKAFVVLFQTLASVANESVEAMSNYLDQMRAKTFDTWQPVRIIGVEAEKMHTKILNNTGLKHGSGGP